MGFTGWGLGSRLILGLQRGLCAVQDCFCSAGGAPFIADTTLSCLRKQLSGRQERSCRSPYQAPLGSYIGIMEKKMETYDLGLHRV